MIKTGTFPYKRGGASAPFCVAGIQGDGSPRGGGGSPEGGTVLRKGGGSPEGGTVLLNSSSFPGMVTSYQEYCIISTPYVASYYQFNCASFLTLLHLDVFALMISWLGVMTQETRKNKEYAKSAYSLFHIRCIWLREKDSNPHRLIQSQ